MNIQSVVKSGTIYTTKIMNGVKYEKIKKVLPDGKVFSTIKETLKNGDTFSKTKLNGKTVVTTMKRNFIEPNSGNPAVSTFTKRFLPNGDIISTDKFINSRSDVLTYLAKDGYEITPVKKPFLTKEIITTKDLYSKGQYPSKRIFSSIIYESPVGETGNIYNNSAASKWKEMGFLKTKLWEKDGKIKNYEIYDRYIK